GGGRGLACVLLVLLAGEIDRAAETGGIAGGKKMLGRRRARFAGAAHLLRHRQVGADDAVARLRVAVASALGGRGRGVERLDLVHGGLRCFLIFIPPPLAGGGTVGALIDKRGGRESPTRPRAVHAATLPPSRPS